MRLPGERVAPYLRALEASLEALAPNDDFVPLSEGVAHLRALSPGLGGDQLAPAEVSGRTGMPGFAWLDRARAEQVLALRTDPRDEASDAELQRAASLDPALGQRLRGRRDLHRHLRSHELLPALRLQGAVRRLEPVDVAIWYDRMAPDGRWLRLRVELRLDGGRSPLQVHGAGRLHVDDTLQHFFTRHFADRIDALVPQLEEACSGEVRRVARSWIGPFWFPGIALPEGVPEALGSGLLLHASTEVASVDIEGEVHHDPLVHPLEERLPPRLGVFRERRFAATGRVVGPTRAWAEERGCRNVVVSVGGGVRRRL